LLDAALAVYREVGDQRGQASALEELMAVELNVGDLDRARARGEESLARYRALGDDYGSFNALWILGIVSTKLGDFARAHAELDDASRLAGALSPAFPRYVLRARGWLAVAEGDVRHAVRVFEEALAQARAIEFEPAMATVYDDLGWLAFWQRNWERAGDCFAEELALGAKLSDDWYIARGMLGLAAICADTGRPARAAWLFGAAETACRVDVIDDDTYNPIRAPYERAVALTRRSLGAAVFEEGWLTGRALPRQQAIIRALSDAGGRDVSLEEAPADAVASYERLTRREAEVLRLVAQRQTDGEIADALYISRRTASSHVARILGKLDVANRREAGVVAARLGLI
jgi:non-specific serine/threonine protein kinase